MIGFWAQSSDMNRDSASIEACPLVYSSGKKGKVSETFAPTMREARSCLKLEFLKRRKGSARREKRMVQSQFDKQVRHYIYDSFVKTAQAPTREHCSRAFSCPQANIQAAFQRL